MAYVFKEFPKHVLGKIVHDAVEEAAWRAKVLPSTSSEDPFASSADKGREGIPLAVARANPPAGVLVNADTPDMTMEQMADFVDGPLIVTPVDAQVAEDARHEAEERAGDGEFGNPPARRGPGRPPKVK